MIPIDVAVNLLAVVLAAVVVTGEIRWRRTLKRPPTL